MSWGNCNIRVDTSSSTPGTSYTLKYQLRDGSFTGNGNTQLSVTNLNFDGDGSFETPSVGAASYQQTPDGTQTAFLQGYGSNGSVSQPLTFSASGTYHISFQAAQRSGQVQPIQVSVDGVAVGSPITPTGTAFASYSSASFTISTAGSHTIKLAATDSTGDKTTFIDKVTVVSSPLSVANAASATPNPVTGKTTSVSVLGADAGGEANLTYTWAATGPAAVTFSPNGTNAAKNAAATFSQAGSYTLTATITNAAGANTTSSVTVPVSQTLTAITVTPTTVFLDPSGIQQFTATATDQFGSAITPAPAVTWAVTNGGTITSGGLFTAGSNAGTSSVTAASGSVTGTATVTVPATVTATALTSSLNPTGIGQSITLTATVTGTSPTGTVTFTDAATLLGTAPLTNGAAAFTTNALAVGTHSLTASYGGDSANATSQSPALTQNVTPDVTSQVTVVPLGFRYNRAKNLVQQLVTLTNNGPTLTGPVSLVLDTLPAAVVVYQPSGTTQTYAPLNSAYVNAALTGSTLATGASVTVPVSFYDPYHKAVTYSTRVLAGDGSR